MKLRMCAYVVIMALLNGCGATWDNVVAEGYGTVYQDVDREKNIRALEALLEDPGTSYETKLIAHYSMAALHLGSITAYHSINSSDTHGQSYPEIIIQKKLLENPFNRGVARDHLMIVSTELDVTGQKIVPSEDIKRKLSFTDLYLALILKFENDDESLVHLDRFLANPYALPHGRFQAKMEADSLRGRIAQKEYNKQLEVSRKNRESEESAKKMEMAARDTPEAKREAAERRISYLNNRIKTAYEAIEREKKIAAVSGYENKTKLYSMGNAIVVSQEEIDLQWKIYKEHGGDAISPSELK